MTPMNKNLLACAACLVLLFTSTAKAGPFPGFGNDTNGPELIITIHANGTANVTTSSPDQGPYDGSEDTYIGVINNYGSSIKSLTLTTSPFAFSFDGDGIDAFGAPSNPMDLTGYGGPNAFFTNFTSNGTTGTVNFINPIPANGGTDYFSLEEPLAGANFVVTVGAAVPEPTSLALFGLGTVGLAGWRLRRNHSSK
jgi:hypothetical protein